MGREYHTRAEILSRFQYLGVSYISRPLIDYPLLDSFDPRDGNYYFENHELLDELADRYAALIRNGSTGPVYIKYTGEMGHGLFAGRNLERGDFIGEYTGIVRESIDEEIPLDDERLVSPERVPVSFATDYTWNYPACFDGVDLEIDAGVAGNETRFVNHSFHPNLEVEHTVVDGRWSVFYIAGCSIRRDEQLFVNYGEGYWEGRYPLLVLEWG